MRSRRVEYGDLFSLYEKRKEIIRRRLEEFRSVKPEEYFYEMAFCLLTPQTSALNAMKAVEALKSMMFRDREIDPLPLLHTKEYYIRFHRTKSARLIDLKKSSPQIIERLTNNSDDAVTLRKELVKKVNGYGLKEATHFLRNIGKSEGLAILDRHILRNLKKYSAISSVPDNLPEKRYYLYEEKFLKFALKIEIPADELDLLFWSMETGTILK